MIRHKSQCVTLTGFGSETFEKAVNQLQRFDDLFLREVGEQAFEPSIAESNGGYAAVEIRNWLFTSLDIVRGAVHVDYNPNQDPQGLLEAIRGQNLVRTEDNVVDYYDARTFVSEGNTR